MDCSFYYIHSSIFSFFKVIINKKFFNISIFSGNFNKKFL